MNSTPKKISPSDLLVAQFLEKAKEFQTSVELIKVLKSRTYKIGDSNVWFELLLKETDVTSMELIILQLRKLPIWIIPLLLSFVVLLKKL